MSATDIHTAGSHSLASNERRNSTTFIIVALVKTWIERNRKRSEYFQLLKHSDKLLNDIGVSRGHLQREASKPFWRA